MTQRLNRPLWAWLPTIALTAVFVYLLRSAYHSNGVMIAGGNVWEVADWICMRGLARLTNKLAVASQFNTDKQAEFEREFPVGDTVRVPLPVQGVIRTGLGYSGAPVVAKHTNVVADQIFGMDFDYDSIEEALRMGRSKDWIGDKIIDPFMDRIANEWDLRAAQFAIKNTPNITTGALGTNPSTFNVTSAESRQEIVEYAGWADDNGIFLPPAVMTGLRTNFAMAFNPVDDVSKAFRTGIYRHADGFDFYEAMTLGSFTTGTWASPGSLTVRTSSVSGDTTLDINCTTGDVFNEGDVIQVTGRYRVNPLTKQAITARYLRMSVGAQTTGASSHASVPIEIGPYGIIGPGDPYQNVDSLPVANDVVTMWPGTTLTAATAVTGTCGLAFTRNAFLLVGIPLQLPKMVEKKAQKRDEATGIAVRFTSTWDPIQSRIVNRLDTCGGFGVGNSDSCAVKIPCA